MSNVCLRPVTMENFRTCVRLRVEDDQAAYVATNVESLAQAYVNSQLTPCAIYEDDGSEGDGSEGDGSAGDGSAGDMTDDHPMVGFVMYQVRNGVGFIMRLMVDAAHQRRGYGRAAMTEVVRRLKAEPTVDRIATSVIPSNDAARELYVSLGFEPFEERGGELYLRLPYGRDA